MFCCTLLYVISSIAIILMGCGGVCLTCHIFLVVKLLTGLVCKYFTLDGAYIVQMLKVVEVSIVQ